MAKTKSQKLRQRSKSVATAASLAAQTSTASTTEQPASTQADAGDIGSILRQLRESTVDADMDTRSVVTSKSLHGLNLKKRDKRKLRHAVWTKKVGAIEAQIKEVKARKKNSSTVITGDMTEMLDSLPTFELLLDRATVQSRHQQHKDQKRKERSVETETARRQQRLADISLFKSVLVHPTFKSSSASALVEHLRSRLQHDDTL